MAFDAKKFDKSKFSTREKSVKVESVALQEFFEPGEEMEMTVRGLTGEEMARCNDAKDRQKNVAAVLEALAGSGHEKVQAIRESMGLADDSMPGDAAKRIEAIKIGCVDLGGDERLAVKLFKVAPVDAYGLSNQIFILSGQGMMPGEQKASGDKQKSATPVISDTPEGACSTS